MSPVARSRPKTEDQAKTVISDSSPGEVWEGPEARPSGAISDQFYTVTAKNILSPQ